MRQKMPVRVQHMVVLIVVLAFYIPFAVLTMDTNDQLVSVGNLVAGLCSLTGLLANFAVTTANNWRMPVSSLARDTDRHCVMTDATRLNWLGDRFVFSVSYNVFKVSIGDICIIFGCLFSLIFFSIYIVGKIT